MRIERKRPLGSTLLVPFFAAALAACAVSPGEGTRTDESGFSRDRIPDLPVATIDRPIHLPTDATAFVPATVVGEANDPASILADADTYWKLHFEGKDDKAKIDASFAQDSPPIWEYGAKARALVQMYDLVAPLDPVLAGRFLERLRVIGEALIANRDDIRFRTVRFGGRPLEVHPVEQFRNRTMKAWGGWAVNRDGKWNADPVTAGVFGYALAAFGRRVAENPALQEHYTFDAMRFITAAIEAFEAFRPELHLLRNDPHAYFTIPRSYGTLTCANGADGCEDYRDSAGWPISYNENFAMLRALSELAVAADSPFYRGSFDGTPARVTVATVDAPLVVAKSFKWFDSHLRSKTLSDGTPYWETWQQQTFHARTEDIGHAQFLLVSLAVMLENQDSLNAMLTRAGMQERVGLSTPLFARFANTFLRKIWKYDFANPNGVRNKLSKRVDGSGPVSSDYNAECNGFLPLAQFDGWVWTRCLGVISEGAGHLTVDNHAALLRYRGYR